MSEKTQAPVMGGEAFIRALRARGFDFYAGVPCSLIKDVLAYLDEQKEVPYIAAHREDSALGMAAGAAMAGKRPVVLMQNSGLGVSINALVSLQQIYQIPTLLLITWRGCGGKDAPEHIIMGPAMPALLDLFKIPYRVLEPAPPEGKGKPSEFEAAIDWADATLRETQKPCALIVKSGAL